MSQSCRLDFNCKNVTYDNLFIIPCQHQYASLKIYNLPFISVGYIFISKIPTSIRNRIYFDTCIQVVGIISAVANFFMMFFVSDIVEDKPVSEDFGELYLWACVIDILKAWLMMGIGVKALKAIKRRSSKVSKRMMKHACCLAFMFVLMTVVTFVLSAHMYKVGMPAGWDDKMWVQKNPDKGEAYEINFAKGDVV